MYEPEVRAAKIRGHGYETTANVASYDSSDSYIDTMVEQMYDTNDEKALIVVHTDARYEDNRFASTMYFDKRNAQQIGLEILRQASEL